MAGPGTYDLYVTRFDPDVDGGGTLFACDCDDTDPGASTAPQEVRDLSLLHQAGAGGATHLSWNAPPAAGTQAYAYDVLAADAPDGFLSPDAACLESDDGSDLSAVDDGALAPGVARYFLVRAENACGSGSLGRSRPQLLERPGRACP